MRFSITYPTNHKTEKVEATVIKRKKEKENDKKKIVRMLHEETKSMRSLVWKGRG